MRHTIVYVSHKEQNCGVYQFGRRIGEALERSAVFDFRYRECGSVDDLQRVIDAERPAAIIYNFYPSTLPWVTSEVTRDIPVAQIGTLHEVTQSVADQADRRLFDFHIAPDPTLVLRNPLVFKTGRFVAAYHNTFSIPAKTTIGTFGFGVEGKGLEYLVAAVQKSFDIAHLRLHLPNAQFGDRDGSRARAIVANCKALIYKPEITLEASHDFLDQPRLLDFLAQNTCNAFGYNQVEGRGISSALDYAIGVGRPIAIRRTSMMRHLWDAIPSICLDDRPLSEIIASGTAPLEPYREQWCEANLIWDYERIVRKVLATYKPRPRPKPASTPTERLLRRAWDSFNYRVLGKSTPAPVDESQQPSVSHWLGNYSTPVNISSCQSPAAYEPVPHTSNDRLNRILDESARKTYRRTIAELFTWLPDLLSRKISRANVQQAFGLDTVVRLVGAPDGNSRILCVGSFEDSTCWGLKKLGYRLDEVDPVLNYDLAEFLHRPTTKLASYDLIFSISVIEHVEDDEEFLRQMESLLKPGGHLVMTCDYQDAYRPGNPKPPSDCRLYTQADIRDRLLRSIPNCQPVDTPQWDCPVPDFEWDGCKYTFATLVLRKDASPRVE